MVFKHITHLMGYLSITDCLAYRYVTVETHSRSLMTVRFQEDVQAERHFQRQDQSDSGFMGVIQVSWEDDDTEKGSKSAQDRRTFGYSNTITMEQSKFCRVPLGINLEKLRELFLLFLLVGVHPFKCTWSF